MTALIFFYIIVTFLVTNPIVLTAGNGRAPLESLDDVTVPPRSKSIYVVAVDHPAATQRGSVFPELSDESNGSVRKHDDLLINSTKGGNKPTTEDVQRQNNFNRENSLDLANKLAKLSNKYVIKSFSRDGLGQEDVALRIEKENSVPQFFMQGTNMTTLSIEASKELRAQMKILFNEDTFTEDDLKEERILLRNSKRRTHLGETSLRTKVLQPTKANRVHPPYLEKNAYFKKSLFEAVQHQDDEEDQQARNMQQTLSADTQLLDEDVSLGNARSWRSTKMAGNSEHADEYMFQKVADQGHNIATEHSGKHLGRHRRDADAPKSTPADIKNLFQEEKPVEDLTHFTEGGGVHLTSSGVLLTASPAIPSSTTNITLDKDNQSRVDNTHSVGGGLLLNEATPLKLDVVSQTSSTTSQPTNIVVNNTNGLNLHVDSDNVPFNSSNNDQMSHKTVPRKGAEAGKIVGRKGVDDSNLNEGTNSEDVLLPMPLPSANNGSINGNVTSHPNKSLQNASLPSPSVDGNVEVIESNPPLKKKKPNPKPLTLTDNTSFNTTPAPHDRVSSQRDIVVPVVIFILSVPLITILGIFLYKKGSEYWSRRHYRRMDFLIDGMYND